jgi:hypothetical protein
VGAFLRKDAWSTVLVAEDEDVVAHHAFGERRAARRDSAAERDRLPVAPEQFAGGRARVRPG